MASDGKIRVKIAGLVLATALLLLVFQPAAEAIWNHPGVLVMRSQVQLMRGNTQCAVELAQQAILSARGMKALAAATL